MCLRTQANNFNAQANYMSLVMSNQLRIPSDATVSAASLECTYPKYGCADTLSSTYTPFVDVHVAGWCLYAGCTNSLALNYDATANTADTCDMPISGCATRHARREPDASRTRSDTRGDRTRTGRALYRARRATAP